MQNDPNNYPKHTQPNAPPPSYDYAQYQPNPYQPVVQQEAHGHPDYGQTYQQQPLQPHHQVDPHQQTEGIQKEGESDFDCGRSEFGNRMNFKDRKCRDVWALALWIVAMVAMIYGLIALYQNSKVSVTGELNTILIVLILAAIGIATGFMWMGAMKKCAPQIIRTMLYANLVFWALMTIIYFAAGLLGPAIIALIFTVLFGVYVYFVRVRIPLAAAMMNVAIRIIDDNNSTVALQLIIAVLQIAWIVWWGAVMFAYAELYSQRGLVFVGLLIILYWTLQVLANISHTTICGVGAVWFFSKNEKNPTWTSFRYATTKGLGSICLGSLLVALIQTARAMIRNAQQNNRGNPIVLCLAQCFLGCLESLIQFFNTYAYAHVAIYGTSFIESSKRTWNMLTNKGVDAWINDDLTGFALACGALVGALITALVGYLLSIAFTGIHSDMAMGYLFAGFIIGFFLCATVMMVVRSAIVLVFVCWAEDPASMSQNRPDEYRTISEQWVKLYGPRH